MYDNLICNYPLPDDPSVAAHPNAPEAQQQSYQTKDLRCEMDCLEITAEGRLVRTTAFDMAEQDGILGDTNFDGEMCFYTYLNSDSIAPHKPWYEYKAVFKDGQLQTVERIGDQC